MGKEEKSSYSIQKDQAIGDIKIADDVVASIAAHAAFETEGVASAQGSPAGDQSSRFGKRNILKGVRVDVTGGVVDVSVAVNLKYNYNIMEVTGKVQEKVKNAIESMTGLKVAAVNVKVAGIDISSAEHLE